MSIDFTLPSEVEDVRLRVRKFMEEEVRPVADALQRDGAGEVHQQTIARNVLAAYKESGRTWSATGSLL